MIKPAKARVYIIVRNNVHHAIYHTCHPALAEEHLIQTLLIYDMSEITRDTHEELMFFAREIQEKP